ncbi:MAG TPA: PIG-L family deacetylase [Candidatus Dormibacteraeota bacterium]
MNLGRVSLLILAPHPDDEVIGCGGVIQRALANQDSVRVIFVTSGDGYPRAAARLLGKPEARLTPDDMIRLGQARESEAVAAARVMGLDPDDLVFLRYPDAGLASLSPEVRASAVRDVRRVLEESRPSQLYVTDHADEHPDHRVANELAVEAIAASGIETDLFTFIVHSGGDVNWPASGRTYEKTQVGGVTYPVGVAWPPPVRLPVSAEQAEVKVRALMSHTSQWALDHAYLGKFVKSEEVFWKPG